MHRPRKRGGIEMIRNFFRRLSLALALSAPVLGALPLAGSARAAVRPQAAVYFPNWNVYSNESQQVKNLPWSKLDCVYHAFWKIVPQNGGYAVVSTDPWADTDKSNPLAHFPQYAQMKRQYPDVSVMLSIGGWTCSGRFSEMCLTAAGRQSFIQSCLNALDAYPFLSGIDLDWEYPGEARKGGGGNEGNPVVGDDKTNYTLLLKELRAALDGRFGKGAKQLTVCCAASTDILKKQDYAALFPYVNRINVMTYDMTASYDSQTGHQSALYGPVSADTAVKYLMKQGVPAGKICIGSPLYGHGWRVSAPADSPVGAKAQGLSSSPLWKQLQKLETAPGWQAGYDEGAQAAYLYNSDKASPDYGVFYTYDSARSLDAKLKYIRVHSLGGLIVWQSGGDDGSYSMLSRVYQGLH